MESDEFLKHRRDYLQRMIENRDVELSHTLLKDLPEGDWIDGYFAALEWVLKLLEE